MSSNQLFLCPIQCVSSRSFTSSQFPFPKQQVTKLIAPQRIQPRICRLPLHLQPLRLPKKGFRLGDGTRLVQGISEGGTHAHFVKKILALVCIFDRLPSIVHRLAHLTDGQAQLAQVGRGGGGILPIRLRNPHLQARLHRRNRLPQPTQRPQAEASLIQQKSPIILPQFPPHHPPRRFKQPCDGSKVELKAPSLWIEKASSHAVSASNTPHQKPPGTSPPCSHAPSP
jgi:hypothetical protein